MPNFYKFGDSDRLTDVFAPDLLNDLKELNLYDLFKLSPNDVIISSLPWSPFLDLIQAFNANLRPYIIRTADGLITPINSRKPINYHDGGLYARNNGDLFIIKQNLVDIQHIQVEPYPAISVRTIDLESIVLNIQTFSSITLMFGNDPYLGVSESLILNEANKLVSRCRDFGITNISAACPNKKFRDQLSRTFPDIVIKSYSSQIPLNKDNSLIFSSPSTVAIDYLIGGFKVLGFSCYNDAVYDSYFCNSSQFLESRPCDSINLTQVNNLYYRPLCSAEIRLILNENPKRPIYWKTIFRSPFSAAIRDCLLIFRANRLKNWIKRLTS
ncbi:hypothetical protein [Glycocaulis sp.]|uniref:hypothetical protein n=1 Tax=Glycocaulis sp. TaxID=1969725 RepID=UPI003F72D7D2